MLAALVALALAPPASGASWALGEREREEAVRVGQRSVIEESFGAEWQVADARGQRVTVFTPFHRLALAARQEAFRNEALTPAEQTRIVAELRDRLLFLVHLTGSRAGFARHYRPRLVVEGHEIEPAMVQNERTALRQEDGSYLARSLYWFPVRELSGTDRVSLVIRDPDGRPVARFAIDLGKMR